MVVERVIDSFHRMMNYARAVTLSRRQFGVLAAGAASYRCCLRWQTPGQSTVHRSISDCDRRFGPWPTG
jgi:hypothetical protein